METSSDTAEATSVYDQLEDDQWTRADGAGETPAVAEVIETDGSPAATPDDGGTTIPVEAPAGSAVSVSMDVVGELENGDVVVGSSAQFNGDVTNDGRTSDGIGTEFGPWGCEYVVVNTDSGGAPRPEATSSIRSHPWSAIVRPDGQTAAGVERIAGREAELKRIHERYYVPACDAGLVDKAKRDDITQRVAERARASRAALRRRAFAPRGRPAFDMYEDTAVRRQARAAAMRHLAWGAGFLETPRDRVSNDTPTGRVDTGLRAARYADPRSRTATPIARTSSAAPAAAFDPDADAVAELTLRVLETIEPRNYMADSDANVGAASEPTAVERTPQRVRRLVRRLYDVHGDRLSTLVAASRALFHNGSRPLDEIEPFWPAATARVRVERLIDAGHPRIDQVVYVSDVSPRVDGTSTGSEFAKLTVWERSNLDITLVEGDIVLASNVKPGQYRRQLTLAATSDSSLVRVHRGDGAAVSATGDASSGQTPQDLDALTWPADLTG